MRPDQPVAVVTGGSRGIGRAICASLLAADWNVFLCSRDSDSVRQAVDELSSRYPDRVAGQACDVGEQGQVERFVGWVETTGGRIDCLVNNAGIGLFKPVDEISGEEWRRLLRTNLDGCFYFLRAVAPVMKRQGAGRIVNIASLAGRNPIRKGAAYNASKFGLLGLSEASMLDLRSHGILVSAVLPGSVRTEFNPPSSSGEDAWKLAPEDVARAVMDLLSYPEHALPSSIELRPSRPPGR